MILKHIVDNCQTNSLKQLGIINLSSGRTGNEQQLFRIHSLLYIPKDSNTKCKQKVFGYHRDMLFLSNL